MNTKDSLTIVSLVTAIGLSASAYGQVTVTQNVTIALVETTSAPALAAKDESGVVIRGAAPVESNSFSVTNARGVTTNTEEYGTKMVTFRISNKELLEGLVEQGVIESITGYALQLIGSPDEEGYVDNKFYVAKRGETPIDISEYFFANSEDAEAENYSYRSVAVSNPNTETQTFTETGRANGKELIELTYSSVNGGMELEGVVNWAETYRVVGTDPNQVSLWAPGAATVTSIVGSAGDPSSEESDTLIEGRISITAGVVTIAPSE
jgi:hypothetical protein